MQATPIFRPSICGRFVVEHGEPFVTVWTVKETEERLCRLQAAGAAYEADYDRATADGRIADAEAFRALASLNITMAADLVAALPKA